MPISYEETAKEVLEAVKRMGFDQAELYVQDSQEMTIEVAEKTVENMKLAQERGLGLRVISDGRVGYSFSSDLSPEALKKMIDKAVHNSKQSQADKARALPTPSVSFPRLDLYDESIFQAAVEDKVKIAVDIEEAARSYDDRVVITEKAVYQESKYSVSVFNSLGLAVSYAGSYCGGYGVFVAKDGQDAQTGFEMQYVLKYRELDPEGIGKEAGNKAIRMLGASSVPSGTMPVVLDPYTVTGFLRVLSSAFSAEEILKGKSFLKGEEGKKVGGSQISIIDDGTMPGRLGSSPFDGEGTATKESVLVKDGVLQGFLHNSYTAVKYGCESTGNGVRGSYKNLPEIGVTNLYIKNGSMSKKELLRDVKRGLYVTEVLGMHTANPVSGDFSVGAAGLLIENGELTVPVKGVAIAGNLKEFLLDIDAIADDLTFFAGKGAPTVRVRQMSVSGA